MSYSGTICFLRVAVTTCFTAFFVVLFASPTLALTLREAKTEALEANLNIKVINEKVVEASSVSKDLYTRFLPRFSLSGNGTHIDQKPSVRIGAGEYGTYSGIGPVPANETFAAVGEQDTFKVALQVQQPIFQGGRVYYSYMSSTANTDAAGWDKEQVIQDVLLSVEKAYLNLLESIEVKKLAVQHLESIKAHLAVMELKYTQGRVALNDVLQVRVELERAQEDIIKSENGRLMAIGQLNMLLNRPFNQPVEVSPVEDVAPVTITPDEAERLAKLNRPIIKSARTSVQEAMFKRRVAEADFFPSLDVVAEYSNQTEQPSTPGENWLVMLKLDYTLWEWGGVGHRVSAARSAERRHDLSAMAVQNQISADVWQAWLRIQESDKRITVTKEALKQADENLRITKFGFDNGAKTSTDVLDAEDLRSRTLLEHVQARYDAYMSRAELRYAIGIMSVENVEP